MDSGRNFEKMIRILDRRLEEIASVLKNIQKELRASNIALNREAENLKGADKNDAIQKDSGMV